LKNNPFNIVKSFFPARKKSLQNGMRGYFSDTDLIARPFGSAYSYYKDNQYENGFSSIRTIANEFLTIRPYAINAEGNRTESPIIDKLYHPNQDMSSADFREALAIMCLVHPKVYVLAWRYENGELMRGGPITTENLAGFTFLERVTEDTTGEEVVYRSFEKEYTKQDLIIIKGINPYNLNQGFSPSQAARRWTRLDDYIADYEAGFFENGAVPAGQFIIKAKTVRDYEDIVRGMKNKHRGAGANNNVAYVHEPLNAEGQGMGAQITWVPFNTDNDKLDLKNIFENVNKKIDSVYGVPASIRGDNTANTYASVRVDEVIMAKYAVKPLATKIWSKITHELNRITGGTGIAITFDYEIPSIADEEKVKADTRRVDADTLSALTEQGYTFESIVEYVKTNDLSKLVIGESTEEEDQEDVADVDTGDEVDDAPIQEETEAQRLKAKQLSQVDRDSYEKQLSDAVYNRMRIQIDNVIDTLNLGTRQISDNQPIEPSEDEQLTDDMLAVLALAIATQGAVEHEDNLQVVLEAGINTEGVPGFRMTSHQLDRYRAYIRKVATGYNAETAQKIRTVIATGRAAGQTATQIADGLSEVLAEAWRIRRLAVSEVNRAGNTASLYSMQNIAEDTGVDVDKVWVHDGIDTPCEFCQAMIGTRVPINDDFVRLDATVTGVDGGTFVNSFVPIDVAEIHPNGHCRQVYEVRR
jgi:phage portal protein BeeE